jgi:hypothetical protein
VVARRLPADSNGRESRPANFRRNLLGRFVMVAKMHGGTMPDGNQSEQSEFAFKLIANPDDSEPERTWAIVDSNHGPPPYQSGALTD